MRGAPAAHEIDSRTSAGPRTTRRLFSSFPVTIVMLAQMLILYVASGMMSSSPPIAETWPLTWRVFAPVLGGALLVEVAIRIWPHQSNTAPSGDPGGSEGDEDDAIGDVLPARRQRTPILASIVLSGLFLATISRTNSYEQQVLSQRSTDYLGLLVTLLLTAQTVAIASAIRDILGGIRPRLAWSLLAAISGASLISGIVLGYLAGASVTIFTVVVAALIVGILPTRAVLVIAVALVLLVGPAFAYRNQSRVVYAGDQVQSSFSAANRMRMDVVMGTMLYAVPPEALEFPTPIQLARYAVPKFLDPSRPPLEVASAFSLAVGSTQTNSHTFTAPGNAYYLYGAPFVAFWYGLLAGGFHWLRQRRVTLFSTTVLVSMVAYLLYVGTSFPMTVPAFSQSLIYSLGWISLVWAWERLRSPTNFGRSQRGHTQSG